MEQQGFRRQSVDRIVWVEKEIKARSTPLNTKIRLLGVFDITTRHIMVYFIIDHEFTEYRILRLNKAIQPVIRGEIEDLLYAHKNMIAHFMDSMSNKTFQEVLQQWLIWNKNATYKNALTPLLNQNQRKRT